MRVDALKMASAAHVVLLDVNLPDIHGFEVLRRLGVDLLTSHIPVICTSATYDHKGAGTLAIQLGTKRFLTHPISADFLDMTIQEVVADNEEQQTSTQIMKDDPISDSRGGIVAASAD